MKHIMRGALLSIILVIMSLSIVSVYAMSCPVKDFSDVEEGKTVNWFVNLEDPNPLPVATHGALSIPQCNGYSCFSEWRYTVVDGKENSPLVDVVRRGGKCVVIIKMLQINVAPVANLAIEAQGDLARELNISSVTDVSTTDQDGEFTYHFYCDISDDPEIIVGTSENESYLCEYPDYGTYTVWVIVQDKDKTPYWEATEIITLLEPTPVTSTPERPTPVITTGTDTDGDGFEDEDDTCPRKGNEGGLGVDTLGCPYYDADWDGVYDRHDACPRRGNEYGLGIQSNGCPVEATEAPHPIPETIVTEESSQDSSAP